MHFFSRTLFVILALFTLCLQACRASNNDSPAVPLIGISLADLKEERWQRDRDLIMRFVESLGGRVLVQDAGGDSMLQIEQAKILLLQGVKVLIVVPKNANAAAPIVLKAQEKGVKVICYDRLIGNANPDLYISFDNYLVGEIQAREIIKRVPGGKYLLLGGDPADQNSAMLREGQMKALKPSLESKAIEIVAEPFCDKWQRSEGTRYTEDVLVKHPDLKAVVGSNDGIAAGAIASLAAKGLAGKVMVSGQDADLEAVRNIVKGYQTVSVYKPIQKLAEVTAYVAMAFAEGKDPRGLLTRFPELKFVEIKNGPFKTASIFLDPIPLDNSNIESTVIADSFHTHEAIYGK